MAKDETNFMNQEIDGMYMVDTSTAKYAQDLASGENINFRFKHKVI